MSSDRNHQVDIASARTRADEAGSTRVREEAEAEKFEAQRSQEVEAKGHSGSVKHEAEAARRRASEAQATQRTEEGRADTLEAEQNNANPAAPASQTQANQFGAAPSAGQSQEQGQSQANQFSQSSTTPLKEPGQEQNREDERER